MGQMLSLFVFPGPKVCAKNLENFFKLTNQRVSYCFFFHISPYTPRKELCSQKVPRVIPDYLGKMYLFHSKELQNACQI